MLAQDDTLGEEAVFCGRARFWFFDYFAQALAFPLGVVDVLNGEDATCDLVVLVAYGASGGAEPGVGTVFGVIEELIGASDFAVEDCAR